MDAGGERINIYDDILEELRLREVMDRETIAPYYIISYACHSFNLTNFKTGALYMGGRLPNLRFHVINLAPAGYGKSYMLEQMGGGEYGIFNKTKYRMMYEQSITESGFVGTIRVNPATGLNEAINGAAQENSEGFMLFDEFSALEDAMRQSYNASLDTQLLAALDSGRMVKRLSGGPLRYETNFTLWGGVQPVRCDLSRGLGRRLCILLNLPSDSKRQAYRNGVFKSLNIAPDVERLENLRRKIDFWTDSFALVRNITFDKSVPEFYDYIDAESFYCQFYNRMIIGYHLAKHGPEKELEVSLEDSELIKLIEQQHQWRLKVISGPDIEQMINLIKNSGIEVDNEIVISKRLLIQKGAKFQLGAKQVSDKLREMQYMGYIKNRGDRVHLLPEGVPDYAQHTSGSE